MTEWYLYFGFLILNKIIDIELDGNFRIRHLKFVILPLLHFVINTQIHTI
jgi:hypothetical protein